MALYDFIYADLAKATSFYSQLTGGLVELREVVSQRSQSETSKRLYDVKVFQHEANNSRESQHGGKELIKPHHSLLMDLEKELSSKGYLVDINELPTSESLATESLRERLKACLCIKVRGRAVIEDYQRMDGISQIFPEVHEFINKCSRSAIEKSDSYITLKQLIESEETRLERMNDGGAKDQLRRKILEAKDHLGNLLTKAGSKPVDEWVLDGFRKWIRGFLPGIINCRIYPFTDKPEEQVFGHLKREWFEDLDSNSFHFTYGSAPTEDLTLIGVVTSIPSKEGNNFQVMKEFEKENCAPDESVERGFRQTFRGFDSIERMIRTSRFPRILVRPIVVYRSGTPMNQN